MIKFFRKIRYDLMEKNKTGKYFKYAIGEIVLVVIGILIALQINNWNELNKIDLVRQSYYEQLINDLDKDSINIQKYIIILENSINTFEKYLDKLETPDLEIEEVLNELGDIQVTYSIITFNTNTSDILMSTGDIELIPTNIRNSLLEITRNQSSLKNIRDQIDAEYLNLIMKVKSLGFSTHSSPLKNQKKLTELLNVNENNREIILGLDAAFWLKNFSEKDRVSIFNEMLVEIENAKRKIKSEMK